MPKDRPQTPAELFPTDDPIAAREMIGRGEDVDGLAVRLGQAAINCVLIGPRRTGKTTVCRAAVERLADQGLYTASIDLFHLSRVSQIADALVEATIANRPALSKTLHRARAGGRSLAEAAAATVSAKLPGAELEGIEINLLPQLRRDPDRYLDYALRLPQTVAAADRKRLILYIDEFQDIVRIGDADYQGGSVALARKLRAVFQDSPEVVFLFAGSIEHMVRDLFGRREQAFFNFGSIQQLSPISVEEWRTGLSRRFRRGGYTITDGALELLIRDGQDHPRSTMLLAQQAVLVALLRGSTVIEHAEVELALHEAMRSERPRHEGEVEHLRALGPKGVRKTALPVAVAVARGDPALPVAGSQWQANRTLKALRDAGIIEGKGRDRVRISDPLLGRFLRALDLPTL
jgi:hypothetical protein